MPRTTRCESSTWRELPVSRAPALSASRSGRASSGQPQQVVRADEQRRDPLDAVGRGRRLPVEALRQLTGESHPRVPQMEPLFYRPAEAAAALRVSRSKVYELMNRGEIPWVRLGGVRRLPVEALRHSHGRGTLIGRDAERRRDSRARPVPVSERGQQASTMCARRRAHDEPSHVAVMRAWARGISGRRAVGASGSGAAGARWRESGLVFTSTVGTPLDERNLNRLFKAILRDANLPAIRYHDLRHTAATLLLAQGVDPRTIHSLHA